MSQKYIKSKVKSVKSPAYGKYFAQAVYDEKFIETDELAAYIQQQASVKRSDIGAVLDELGDALKHYFELGQKVRIKGLGIFKVGFSSIGVTKLEDCTAATITSRAFTKAVDKAYQAFEAAKAQYNNTPAGQTVPVTEETNEITEGGNDHE